jgi:hypothetical protein
MPFWVREGMDVGVRSSNDIYDPIGQVGGNTGCPPKSSTICGHPSVKHTENVQDEDFMSEQLRDIIMDPVIVNLQESSSSSENSDTCEKEEVSDDELAQELHSDKGRN